jgi:3(or 17)beta-hydroxysteroid dehydrogenase
MRFLFLLFTVSALYPLTGAVNSNSESHISGARLEGKVALVTGAASGIGKETAIFLAREGAQVILSDVNDKEGREAAKQIGDSSIFMHLDVSKEADWAAAMKTIQNKFSRLDILVNNAGITGLQVDGEPDPENGTLEKWRAIQAVNFEGIILGCKHAIRLMKNTTDSGSIINISSIASLVGFPDNPFYAASKGAVNSYTKSVAMYCCQEGYAIRCNCILPGFILTPMLLASKTYSAEEVKQLLEQFLSMTPMRKMGMPEDIAQAALFLASDESKYINGTEFLVDGGATAWGGLPFTK